jgi:N6-L-threonylcarbamoyladenine synthase
VLAYKVLNAAREKGCRHVALVGGVAANSRLRAKVAGDAAEKGIRVHVPALHLCGDNAAMIASVGYHYLKAGKVSNLSDDVFSRSR